jgi:hypothetical protein
MDGHNRAPDFFLKKSSCAYSKKIFLKKKHHPPSSFLSYKQWHVISFKF